MLADRESETEISLKVDIYKIKNNATTQKDTKQKIIRITFLNKQLSTLNFTWISGENFLDIQHTDVHYHRQT